MMKQAFARRPLLKTRLRVFTMLPISTSCVSFLRRSAARCARPSVGREATAFLQSLQTSGEESLAQHTADHVMAALHDACAADKANLDVGDDTRWRIFSAVTRHVTSSIEKYTLRQAIVTVRLLIRWSQSGIGLQGALEHSHSSSSAPNRADPSPSGSLPPIGGLLKRHSSFLTAELLLWEAVATVSDKLRSSPSDLRSEADAPPSASPVDAVEALGVSTPLLTSFYDAVALYDYSDPHLHTIVAAVYSQMDVSERSTPAHIGRIRQLELREQADGPTRELLCALAPPMALLAPAIFSPSPELLQRLSERFVAGDCMRCSAAVVARALHIFALAYGEIPLTIQLAVSVHLYRIVRAYPITHLVTVLAALHSGPFYPDALSALCVSHREANRFAANTRAPSLLRRMIDAHHSQHMAAYLPHSTLSGPPPSAPARRRVENVPTSLTLLRKNSTVTPSNVFQAVLHCNSALVQREDLAFVMSTALRHVTDAADEYDTTSLVLLLQTLIRFWNSPANNKVRVRQGNEAIEGCVMACMTPLAKRHDEIPTAHLVDVYRCLISVNMPDAMPPILMKSALSAVAPLSSTMLLTFLCLSELNASLSHKPSHQSYLNVFSNHLQSDVLENFPPCVLAETLLTLHRQTLQKFRLPERDLLIESIVTQLLQPSHALPAHYYSHLVNSFQSWGLLAQPPDALLDHHTTALWRSLSEFRVQILETCTRGIYGYRVLSALLRTGHDVAPEAQNVAADTSLLKTERDRLIALMSRTPPAVELMRLYYRRKSAFYSHKAILEFLSGMAKILEDNNVSTFTPSSLIQSVTELVDFNLVSVRVWENVITDFRDRHDYYALIDIMRLLKSLSKARQDRELYLPANILDRLVEGAESAVAGGRIRHPSDVYLIRTTLNRFGRESAIIETIVKKASGAESLPTKPPPRADARNMHNQLDAFPSPHKPSASPGGFDVSDLAESISRLQRRVKSSPEDGHVEADLEALRKQLRDVVDVHSILPSVFLSGLRLLQDGRGDELLLRKWRKHFAAHSQLYNMQQVSYVAENLLDIEGRSVWNGIVSALMNWDERDASSFMLDVIRIFECLCDVGLPSLELSSRVTALSSAHSPSLRQRINRCVVRIQTKLDLRHSRQTSEISTASAGQRLFGAVSLPDEELEDFLKAGLSADQFSYSLAAGVLDSMLEVGRTKAGICHEYVHRTARDMYLHKPFLRSEAFHALDGRCDTEGVSPSLIARSRPTSDVASLLTCLSKLQEALAQCLSDVEVAHMRAELFDAFVRVESLALSPEILFQLVAVFVGSRFGREAGFIVAEDMAMRADQYAQHHIVPVLRMLYSMDLLFYATGRAALHAVVARARELQWSVVDLELLSFFCNQAGVEWPFLSRE